LALAARGPSGIPSSCRVQRRDSLDDPLLGFSSSSRCCPKSPPTASRPKAPLLGFRSLQRMKEKRVHVRRCLATLQRPPGRYPGSAPAGPIPPVTVSLSGFLNLSATLFLSPPSHHFQVGDARGFHPSRGCSSREASVARHHRPTLMTLFPRSARSPILGGGIRGRACRCLGWSAWRL
jgi:hypothetical protein